MRPYFCELCRDERVTAVDIAPPGSPYRELADMPCRCTYAPPPPKPQPKEQRP